MAKKKHNSKEPPKDYVVVFSGSDMEEIEDIKILLEMNGITVFIGGNEDNTPEEGSITVMVPKKQKDMADAIIETYDAYDDFYDFSLEDEDD